MLHIEYLMLRHDCVIVPGIGAFLKLRTPARFDNGEGKWYPMSVGISFNPDITHDDGLLAASYARKYRVSFRDAKNMLESDVRILRDSIRSEGEATIGNLGILKLDDNGSLSFIPRLNPVQYSTEIGLIPVSGSVIKEEGRADISQQIISADNSDVDIISKEETPDSRIARLDFDNYYYIPVNKRVMKAAASLLLLAVIAVSIFLPSSRRELEDQASVLPVEAIIDTAIDRPDSKGESETAAITIDQPISSPNPEEASDAIRNDKDENLYYLIVGTFRSLDEANRFVATAHATGYDLEVKSSKTLHRVSAMSSSDKASLLKELNSSNFQSLFPQAWIWKM